MSSAVTKVKTTAKQAVTKVKTTVKQTIKKITKNAETKAKKQYEKKTHTEKVGKSRSPKRMTDSAKKAQKKAAKEAGKGFKDSFKDTVHSVKSAGKTLVNATGINGKQKKEQAVDKIYGITRGIGTTIAHPIRSVKEIASAIREKAKEKGESYVGGYILGEVTQTVAAAGAAAAAGKGLKGAKAAKKTKPKKKNDLADTGSKGLNTNLLDELANSGLKYNPEDIVAITKTADGKLLWLENGTDAAGLNHIITEHADDFLNKGITKKQIPNYIMSALKNGKIVGYQGRGTGRPIYEFTYNGEIHKVAITVGNNGFIVGANPK